MKKLFSLFLFAAFAMVTMAQSSDFHYPMGRWYNGEADRYIEITINRTSDTEPGYGDRLFCGELQYEDIHVLLSYAGRMAHTEKMPSNMFLFNVFNTRGKIGRIGILKETSGNNQRIMVFPQSGFLVNNPDFKEYLTPCMYANGTHWHDYTYEATTYADFLSELEGIVELEDKMLRRGDTEDFPLVRGFGNVREYVNAHKVLKYGRPVYAKCKGASKVNISSNAGAGALKTGELLPGKTLYVVDEYDGWCQVRMENGSLGWVKLQAVTLTNNKSKEEAPKNAVRGDLGAFDLYGPVKSCTFKNQYGSNKRTFDRNGTWLTLDGKPLNQIYKKGITRNRKNQIIKGIYDSDGNADEYQYNAEGRLVKYNNCFFDTLEEDTYTYDANGKQKSRHVVQEGMDAMGPYTEVYQIQTEDRHGNWTKRIVTTGSERSVETRIITYYE